MDYLMCDVKCAEERDRRAKEIVPYEKNNCDQIFKKVSFSNIKFDL